VGISVAQRLVDPPEQFDLGRSQGDVRRGRRQRAGVGGKAQDRGEATPQDVVRGTGRRDSHQVAVGGRDEVAPAAEHAGGDVEVPEGFELAGFDGAEEGFEAPDPSFPDALLPHRREGAPEVAAHDDDVHLGGGQAAHRSGRLGRRRAAQGLVGDDHVAGPVGRLRGEPVPRPGGCGVAPTDLAQVGHRLVVGRGGAGEEQAGAADRVAVGPEHVLDVGAAGLRRTDVQEDASGHGAQGGIPRARHGIKIT
jgi:hypothetical protein